MKVTLIRSRAIDPSITKIAGVLSKKGYEVKILIWDRQNSLKTSKLEGYKFYKFCLRAPYDKFTALFYLPFWWLYEIAFLLKDDSDVVHACDFDTLPPAVFAKLIKKINLFYIIYDFYANNLSDGSINSLRKFIRFAVSSLEKAGIGFTDTLFLVDECRFDEVKGAKIKNIVYIYNSPPDYVYQKDLILKKTEITLFYAGVIIKARGIFDMIAAVKNVEGVKLILAGTGPDMGTIRDLEKDIKNIEYIGHISYEEVIRKSMESDILFRFSDPNLHETKLASPNKLFEAMMCSKPIIVSDNSAMAKIVRKENCGIVVPYGHIKAIKESIIKLKQDPQLRNELGKNGRVAYENKYSWKIMEERLLSAYREISENNST